MAIHLDLMTCVPALHVSRDLRVGDKWVCCSCTGSPCVRGDLFCVDMCVSPEGCRSYLLRVPYGEGYVCLRSDSAPAGVSVLVTAAL